MLHLERLKYFTAFYFLLTKVYKTRNLVGCSSLFDISRIQIHGSKSRLEWSISLVLSWIASPTNLHHNLLQNGNKLTYLYYKVMPEKIHLKTLTFSENYRLL